MVNKGTGKDSESARHRSVKATLILADAARTHPDGTFSLLRGGIDRVTFHPARPPVLRATLMARITCRSGEDGEHTFQLRLMDQDGNVIGPEHSGSFTVPRQGGKHQISLDLQMVLPGEGVYEFVVTIDGSVQDTWPITVVKATPEEAT